MKKLLEDIEIVMMQKYKTDISVYDNTFLNKAIQSRFSELPVKSNKDYLHILENDPNEMLMFSVTLNNNFSEFFRNPVTYSVLEYYILPDIIAKSESQHNSSLRIWSAGCAAGHEAYSLAIILSGLRFNHLKNNPFSIFATDKSATEIEKAFTGKFDYNSVRKIRFDDIEKYFVKTGETWCATPLLKKNILFEAYDLLDTKSSTPPGSIYGDFDLVMCCNVMLYYNDKVQQRIMEKLLASLKPGGYFVTGEAEAGMINEPHKLSRVFSMAPVFRKNE